MSRIEHFAVFADDLEALKSFYVDVMGLKIAVDNSSASVRGYFLADDRGVCLEIIERPAHARVVDTRFVCHAAFLVDDLENEQLRLEALGVVFEAETAVHTDAFKTVFFRDPAGNRCQIVWRRAPLVRS